MEYEKEARQELEEWRRKITKRSGILSRAAKGAQLKINNWIPDKVQAVITEGIRKMVQGALYSSEFLTKSGMTAHLPLKEKETLIWEKLERYKKLASAEGAGTGAGGFFLGLADFPLLLSIKMKFLFDTAAIHGFDTDTPEERSFILHVFQLAFSSDAHRKKMLGVVENWEEHPVLPEEIDWKVLQQEYRDYLDFVKMLQLVPGIGAAVGAYANYNLLHHLGETALNAYRIRYFSDKKRAQAF
ncbi:ABC transporter-associated protein EcsC [Weizmannia acidilactici]|uniref:ABC transporter-associated protein EcsC n=1 Tax=Weizmannia acidilactici TaxID=2607726 RepID=A0A5J4JKR3_9BACI|nr:EcsC family protein [Weizmannia acidilactici]GER65800.1 ABC transporter-associated protein EcsC [Weizmannia acidilactici]GER71138.1 ABC transporter-associated protein EcsC [Weizmannia acidilactici]